MTNASHIKSYCKETSEKDVNDFLDYISALNMYDVFYQNIELPYGKSIKSRYKNYKKYEEATWNAFKNVVNWKNKTVADVGCLNGLYSFKIKEKQAKKVVGYDLFPQACDIASRIAKLKCLDVSFRVLDASTQHIPEEYDVILLLNVLHHCTSPIFVLENIFGKGHVVILEVQFEGFNRDAQAGHKRLIKNTEGIDENVVIEVGERFGHSLIKEVESIRPFRTILVFKKL